MEWLGTAGWTASEWVEAILWAATWLAILAGLVYEGGRRMVGRATRRAGRLGTRGAHGASGSLLRASVTVVAIVLAVASVAHAGQGWWWGSPVNPGFDSNTVIQVMGTASQVDIVPRGGPSMLTLQTASERFTVMLGPGWYLSEEHADIQNGDPLVIEGSKMMDRAGHLHLVAARVTNQRTGTVLQLRDEAGRPRWAMGRPGWKR